MDKKKVVVTFCEAGQGHIVTAEAIAESLEKKYGDKIEVERAYIFRDSNDKDLLKYEKFSIGEVLKANNNRFHLVTQMVAMKVFGEKSSLKFVYGTVFKKVRNKVIDIFSGMNADMIVSTYFAPYHMACVGKKKGKFNSTIVAYDPDHNTHGWWDRRGDLFLVNNEFAKDEAVNVRGFKEDVVKAVNFMTRQAIVNSNESKEFYREKHNIPKDKFAVILADGAYAAAKLEDYTDELLKTDLPLTIIPVCGKNQKLYDKYTNLIQENAIKPNITFMPMPFLSDIQEYYKASDLFVTKAGPNAITDCVFMGTPILTNFYSGEIEKATNELFTEYFKVGNYCGDAKKARTLIESYIKNPSLLDEYRKNTQKLDKTKNGADEIADILAKELKVI